MATTAASAGFLFFCFVTYFGLYMCVCVCCDDGALKICLDTNADEVILSVMGMVKARLARYEQ